MIQSLTNFVSQPILVQLISLVVLASPLLALFFFVAPLFAAFTISPLPSGEWFPDHREKITLVWAIFLLPLASLIVALWDVYDYVFFAVLTPSLCVFLTALAGRRPFLYSLLVGLLLLVGSAACSAALHGGWYSLLPLDGWHLQIFVSFAVSGALFSGLFLFLLWRRMERNPEMWQAAPGE